MFSPIRPMWLFAFVFFSLLVILPHPSSAAAQLDTSTFCKCVCFGNSTIVPIYPVLGRDAKHPCLSCTMNFCLDQKLPSCKGASRGDGDLDTGTGKDGDVTAVCFKRDSPRDHVIVFCFIVLVVGLLGVAFVRNKLEKAGWDPRKFTEGGFWRDAIANLPSRATGGGAGGGPREMGQGGYAPVSVGS